MNMNVLPLEIVNTSNDAEASLLLCCPPEISTKIQWNILQYQSKFLKSQIIPIYYHSHLTYHNNNNRNSNNSNNDENMIHISSWQLISNMLHQIIQKHLLRLLLLLRLINNIIILRQ